MKKRMLTAILAAVLLCAVTGLAAVKGSAQAADGLLNREIRLEGDRITGHSGVRLQGSVVTITKAGRYHISGALTDGQILVDAGKKDQVVLCLEGVDIACSNGAPIYIKKAAAVQIELAENTENTVSDGVTYALEADADEPDAAIFSKCPLTFWGPGGLTVHGYHSIAIHGKDDVNILGGSLTLDAVGDGLKGRDRVYILGGALDVTAGADGIQSNNALDPDTGYIQMDGGSVTVRAAGDGLKAERALCIGSGTLDVTAGADGIKAKNIAGDGELDINGGVISVDAGLDGIQSGGALYISGGDISLTAGDDALQSAGNLTVEEAANLTVSAGDHTYLCGGTLSVHGTVVHP